MQTLFSFSGGQSLPIHSPFHKERGERERHEFNLDFR